MEKYTTDRSRLVAGALGYEQIHDQNREIIHGVMHIIGRAAEYDRAVKRSDIEAGIIFKRDDPLFANPKELQIGYRVSTGLIDGKDLLLSTRRFERMLVAPKIRIRKENDALQIVLGHNQQHNSPFEWRVFPDYNTVVLDPTGDVMVKNGYPRTEGHTRPLTEEERDTLGVILGHIDEKLDLFLANPNRISTRHHPVFKVGNAVKDIGDYKNRIREHSSRS